MIALSSLRNDKDKIDDRRAGIIENLIDETLTHRMRAGEKKIDIVLPRIVSGPKFEELAQKYASKEGGWAVKFDDPPRSLDGHNYVMLWFSQAEAETPPPAPEEPTTPAT